MSQSWVSHIFLLHLSNTKQRSAFHLSCMLKCRLVWLVEKNSEAAREVKSRLEGGWIGEN
jgi:hypothetical protein